MTWLDIGRARRRVALRIAPLARSTSIGVVGALLAGLVFYLARYDGLRADGGFAGVVAIAIAAALALLTGRVMFPAVVVALGIALIHLASVAKQRATDIVLHAYDLVRVATSWPTIVHLAGEHGWQLVAFLFVVSGIVALGWLAWRLDGWRIRRGAAFLMLLAAIVAASVAAEVKGPRRHTELYFEDIYLSTFFASFSETVEALLRGSLIEASPAGSEEPFGATEDCRPGSDAPNIILIHQESAVPPALFKGLDYDRRLDRMFLSHDGGLHRMRVSTYGGASWLTEFSVLTGLSSEAFSGLRQAVQTLMAGRVGETLPQVLQRCGYRAQMFYPMLKSYMSAGRFFSSIGFDDIRDAKDQKAKRANERDRFYFDSMLGEMERHFATGSGQPLFAFVETMATHGGYGYAYMPEVDVPGGGPGTPAEMSEYLRRLAMSRLDHEHLRAELARRFPGRPFLIVHYGDHHPTATQPLLGISASADIEQVMSTDVPLRFVTYFAVDGVGYAPPPLPDLELVDAAYLGTVMLKSARLPLSEVYRERARLMRVCRGAYMDCPRREEILRFHRRLIASGLVAGL